MPQQKCAVMSLVRNVAKQEAPHGITVNNISPGVIDTPRNADALADAVYSKKFWRGFPAAMRAAAMISHMRHSCFAPTRADISRERIL